LDKQKSKFNQASIKEVKVGIIGAGMSFGDVDTHKKRNYMYTLRTLCSDCSVLEINARDFMTQINICNKETQLAKFSKSQDSIYINKLAHNIYNMFLGMNIDGKSTATHQKLEKIVGRLKKKIDTEVKEQ
jgi:hypothetical protein